MAVDTPAKIAILGAGPIGLEAALYARFLGYDVVLFERGEVCDHVLRWGHVRMFTPFAMNRSLLGVAAIQAQDEQYRPPADDALLSGRRWFDGYLQPLAATDLLADHLQTHTEVLAVGKEEILKRELPGHEDRGDWPFRILVRNPSGVERVEEADVVIDTTGVYGQPNHLGHGGIPALGESGLHSEIEFRLPDILGRDREKYAGRHTLLIGNGMSAATNAVALAQLAREAPGTRVTWIARRANEAGQGGPIATLSNDRLPQRAELTATANRLAMAGDANFTYWPGTVVAAINRPASGEGFQVELSGEHAGTFAFDNILANVGFRPNRALYAELQVHECYATEGPMKLAAALLGQMSADCLDQQSAGPRSLLNPEPNFYILGAKSYGRNSNFVLSLGLEQIRDVFTIIGDRPTLDLYAGAKNLVLL